MDTKENFLRFLFLIRSLHKIEMVDKKMILIIEMAEESPIAVNVFPAECKEIQT